MPWSHCGVPFILDHESCPGCGQRRDGSAPSLAPGGGALAAPVELSPLEIAMGRAALQRGYLSEAKLREARRTLAKEREAGKKTPGGLVGVIARMVAPDQRKDLQQVYRSLQQEQGGAPAPARPPTGQHRRPASATATVGAAPSFASEAPDPGGLPTVAGFTIVRELGKGGMGAVYAAKASFMDGVVALKLLGPKASELDVDRFRVEAKASTRLRHPHIVQIYKHGQSEDGRHFIAMELVDGMSLEDRLIGDAKLAPRHAAELAAKVADALAYAHAQGVLHRDLKPHNVLLDKAGEPKLTDFGLAKLEDRTRSLTASGTVLGTPAYMSPELAKADKSKIGPATDVYGLGATLYRALTGSLLFDSGGMAGLLIKIVTQEPRAPRELAPEVPEALEKIVLRCLA
ncbi:MAG TPA: hypothetical protein DEA08_31770, partial [Planctomycetes bacterium]|nr:hypothetical protein [Planctomycetota bacterium]